jgi:hypothetical protein
LTIEVKLDDLLKENDAKPVVFAIEESFSLLSFFYKREKRKK